MAKGKVIIEIKEGIFLVLDENCHSILGKEANLLAALAFARGALDRVPMDNPFEFTNNTATIIAAYCGQFNERYKKNIYNVNLESASYKRGHATKQK